MDRLFEKLAQWRSASNLFLLALLLAAAARPALAAGSCPLDGRPGATLLLPYFEVDLDDPNGRTTLFSVANAVAQPVLVNVVLWTDLGVPTWSFPVYLTGYDVQTVNLRDLFAGRRPGTAPAGEDPGDTVSPRGTFSEDLAFPGCGGVLPPAPAPLWFQRHLRAVHTGQASPVSGMCAGQSFNDRVARGYVTMDTVSRCASLTPRDPGYFGPGGVATSQNVLWGDFFYIDQGRGFADGEGLVRIKADPAAFTGQRTFYRRYVGGSGADGRQPLPQYWAARFADFGLSPEDGTDLIVWRDSGRIVDPFPCGHPPSWYPLLLPGSYQAFDEQEKPFIPPFTPVDPQPPPPPADQLPAEANRFRIGKERFPIPYKFGWLSLDLGLWPDPSQAWVGMVLKAQGHFSVSLGATVLADACQPGFPPVPVP
ncbi:MAG: hypothetical protein ACJ76N_14745 [Thermoanaerobaculia bacterium]